MNGLIHAQSFGEPESGMFLPPAAGPGENQFPDGVVSVAEGAQDDDADDQLRRLLDGWRKARGFNQKDLAKEVGLRSDRIWRYWMVEPTKLDADLLGKFASVLGIDDADRARMYRLAGHLPPTKTERDAAHTGDGPVSEGHRQHPPSVPGV